MAETVKLNCGLCEKPNSDGTICVEINNPYCNCLRDGTDCDKKGQVNYQQIAAGFAAKYMRNSLNQVLVNNGVVANMASASRLSQKDAARILYNYYLQNGREQYGALLRQITPPSSATLSASDVAVISAAAPALSEVTMASGTPIMAMSGESAGTPSSNVSRVTFQDVWSTLVGGSISTTDPILTTITKASPVAIIGIIAVVAILAFVITKS